MLYLYVNRAQFHREELQLVFFVCKKFSVQFKVVPQAYNLYFLILFEQKHFFKSFKSPKHASK